MTLHRLHNLALAFVAIFAMGAVMGTARSAHADTAQIDVSVRVILAKVDNSGIPADLADLQVRLTQQFGQFSGFELDSSQELTLNTGQSGNVVVPGNVVVSIEYLGEANDRYRLRLTLPGGSTNVSAPPGGLFFVGGPEVTGGTLILAIRPE